MKFWVILVFRLINSLTIETYFQADEYYQSLEPGHFFVYGYGYLTWEWKNQLRSSIHPLIYSIGYFLANDDPVWVRISPKIINAIIASIGEYNLYEFVKVYSNRRLAAISLLLSLVNPFNWYVMTRSFSNNLETVLTIVALRYWPWKQEKKKMSNNYWYYSLAFGFVSCLIRPTNVLIWIVLGTWVLIKKKLTVKMTLVSIWEIVVLLMVNTGLDYYFYRQLTFPVYNFIQFNVVKNLSIFYGVAPWHFYLVQAIPLMMMVYLPFMICGVEKSILSIVMIVYLMGFSMIQHKEFRFIYPLQPIMIYFTARGIDKFKLKKWMIVLGIIVNIVIGLFFTLINERGVIDVLPELNQSSFGLIMPCHSTPWQSYFHNKTLQGWFLTCEPPLHLNQPTIEEIDRYRDESDVFYDSPVEYLQKLIELPQKLVVFEPLKQVMDDEMKEYKLCKRYFNSVFHWDDRRKGDILVYCRD